MFESQTAEYVETKLGEREARRWPFTHLEQAVYTIRELADLPDAGLTVRTSRLVDIFRYERERAKGI